MVKIDIIVVGNQGFFINKINYKNDQKILKGAGKTCLINRYLQDDKEQEIGFIKIFYLYLCKNKQKKDSQAFTYKYEPTIGLNLVTKTIQVNENKIKICIWDTAGQEKYFALTKNYFQKADGIILTFDLTDKQSFNKIQDYWIQQVIDKTELNVKKILVGNKVDLQEDRQVQTLIAAELAQQYKMNYFETSAKTGECVSLAFETLAKQCAFAIQDQKLNPQKSPQTVVITHHQEKKKNCFDKMKEISSKLYAQLGFNQKQ
ncbi:ras oncogene family protein, putative [Ichthyophthirius multifiliis]|uniref:Ras oncogene family protein, putative n=1 Tax=Ichthyophthirius multifiliis TaxID=5932 RepID=G0QW57_ICHMU|nr:ras oncogene family protein, putative [Ichthyophthirius multifiliis]EGR30538.1 ras oncogene family protein, putative [Ichthyophthirius multifiliis]|eukprot:XP_004032125.1 ras oncogene family protein, putative [Ichthyophthirius multifiliis]